MKKYTLSDCYKRGSSRVNKRKRTPIPFLSLSMAYFNATASSKADYARLRATLADRLMAISEPKTRERK